MHSFPGHLDVILSTYGYMCMFVHRSHDCLYTDLDQLVYHDLLTCLYIVSLFVQEKKTCSLGSSCELIATFGTTLGANVYRFEGNPFQELGPLIVGSKTLNQLVDGVPIHTQGKIQPDHT